MMIDFPDLHALVIRLRPERGGPPPDPRGHGAQALFLDLLRQVAPELATQLHAAALSKPFTVAVLPGRGVGSWELGVGGPELRSGRQTPGSVELRVAFTRADLFPIVSHALLQQLPGATLRLGRATLTLADVLGTPGSHPWAGYGSFADLWTTARPASSVTLEFATAAAVGQGTRVDGRQRLGLLPMPETIFGSIARRWNELAPPDLRLEQDAVEAAARDTLVSRYALETTQINLGKGAQKGFLGICTYELPPDPAQARTLSLLSDAVFYLGVGMKTARGMGLCR
ncbi:MAG: CRISPR system precrRNA processing endoribonuclease RAMP protein Cas6, partial [bacterium]|nr:CRISPR system precrRNA processing endoribonuclease RAMP protein Cas6 [bacterium]